jgi:hypothetical protein
MIEDWNWKKEVSRDLMALGSVPFFLLVLTRVYIVDNYLQMFQMIFAVLILFLVGFFWKRFDWYAGVIVIVGVFTSLFYMERDFTIMAIVVSFLGLFGMYYFLERKKVWYGVLLGGIVSLASWWISGFTGIVNY